MQRAHALLALALLAAGCASQSSATSATAAQAPAARASTPLTVAQAPPVASLLSVAAPAAGAASPSSAPVLDAGPALDSSRMARATAQLAPSAAFAPRRVLRVAADPNNLPFTNERCEGFENRIAELVAKDLGRELVYTWRAQRRGFFRAALKEGEADLVLGVPVGFDMALTTRPYYRSRYVFVSRKECALDVHSLDDPRLCSWKVGVQLVGDDGSDTPPAHALALRGIVDNVVGYTLYGDYREANPPSRIVDAVAAGEIDVAAVWGPLAGYFAEREPVLLDVQPIDPPSDPGTLRLAFSIAMGVEKRDFALRDAVDAALTRHAAEIAAILAEFHVPTFELTAPPQRAER